jgi:hypothetical protein
LAEAIETMPGRGPVATRTETDAPSQPSRPTSYPCGGETNFLTTP